MNIRFLRLTAIAVILCIASCKNQNNTTNEERALEAEKTITVVDVSIDTSNAFNSLFFDTTDLREILQANHLNDTLTNQIRSFYNSRNYQFAWFSKEGLPEHTVSFWNLLKNYINYSRDSQMNNNWLSNKMETLVRLGNLSPKNDSLYQNAELLLTRYFYTYASKVLAPEPNIKM